MRMFLAALAVWAAQPVMAQAPDLDALVDDLLLPGYAALTQKTTDLAEAAGDDCSPSSPGLRQAYGAAFDAWIDVGHFRFGPSEKDNRAFALVFWPDPRGATPKTLNRLLAQADPALSDPEKYRDVSIAARGFFALEYLLYDPQFAEMDADGPLCDLIQTISSDIAAVAKDIEDEWRGSYADYLRSAGENDVYRSEEEAYRQLFTALATGLEFTSDARLGRPLGTYDRPRPNRAEARRSGRSLHNVTRSLDAMRDLAAQLSGDDAELDAAFGRAIARAEGLQDPVFAGVSDPQGHVRVEALKQSVDDIRKIVSESLGPQLGISAGFNSLDGD